MRLATRGRFVPVGIDRKEDRRVQVRATGQLTYNNTYQILNAALAGGGLAFSPKPLVHCPTWPRAACRRCMEDWCPTAAGFYLYYPSRRQQSRAQALVIEALRHRS